MHRLLLCLLLCPPAAAFERLAALHETLVSADEAGGAVGLFTYDHHPDHWLGNIALAKLRVGIADHGTVAWLGDAADRTVRNLPGGEGVEVAGTVAGRHVMVELLPSLHGRDTMRWEGSALVKITCRPAAPLTVRCGMPGRVGVHGFGPPLPKRWDYLQQPDLALDEPCTVEPAGDAVTFATDGLPAVAVRSHLGRPTIDGKWLTITSPPVAEGYLLFAFGDSVDRAAELAGDDPAALEATIRAHWRELLASCYLETPEPKLNEAFRAAIINLEYAWVRPFGWIESLHHWGTFWTMQHSLAADWLGQTDRTREMLLAHAERLMPSGQVPDLDPSGRARVDFGGWNQFWCWSVAHYWHTTGDLEFLRQIEEPLRRVVDQTFAAHDPDGNGLLGFGQQIGNQEDYVSTPHDGTSPTIAGIEMLRLRAEVATELHGWEAASELLARAERMEATLREDLYRPDLGRFIYYKDPLGVEHLEGQYHTYIWPVIFGILSGPEAYLSMMHVADTLTGESGEIYCSNNFPRHVPATVGSQAGAQQQPWATLGWAKLGEADKAIAPLRWIADLVTSEVNQGSWPEVNERHPSYFTPPAGVFASAVIEGLFGLSMDQANNLLTVSPCLPLEWARARVVTPDVVMTVKQEANRRVIWVRCAEPRRLLLDAPLPCSEWVEVTADKAGYTRPSFLDIEASRALWTSLEPTREATIVVRWRPDSEPAAIRPSAIAELVVQVRADGLAAVVDPQAVARGIVAVFAGQLRLAMDPGPPAMATEYGAAGRRAAGDRRLFLTVGPPGRGRQPALRALNADELTGRRWTRSAPGGIQPAEQGASYAADAAPLAPGLNTVEVDSNHGRHRTRVDTAPRFTADPDLRDLAYARCRHTALPDDLLTDDDTWRTWRPWLAYGHQPWASLRPPLEGLDPEAEIRPESAPGLSFANPRGRLLPISHQLDRPSVRIPLSGRASRVYLLLVPMLDNHDTFAPVGKVTVKCGDGTYWTRTLHFPGDLDWWGPRHRIGDFATHDTDWCDSLRYLAPESVMNLIELDLNGWRPVESLLVETVGAYPCLAIAAVTAFGAPSDEALAALSPRARELAALLPRRLFGFDAANLDGWETEGAAWGVRDSGTDPWQRRGAGRWFADSLAHREQATGTIRSAPFEVTGSRLTFLTGGHGQRCWFALIDADTGQELRRAGTPGQTGRLQTVTWELADLRGRRVRFVAVDADDGPAYAWIAFDDLVIWP